MTQKIQILDVVRRKDAAYCESVLASQRPETTEILLSYYGLEELCSFGRFKCIEALWLNDNELTEVKGLDTNVQIKALYLHNNKLTSLEPKRRRASGRGCEAALSFLSHIQTLSLYNNRLQDLQAILRDISHLSHLEDLDMSGNPLANELNYRLHVIHTFPSLKILDKHEVTREERMEASTLYGENKAKTIAFCKRRPLWRNPPAQPMGHMSLVTREMYKEIESTKRRRAQEELARTESLMASTTRPLTQGATAPLATAVEMVTANSRTLKDLLALDPAHGGGGGGVDVEEGRSWTAEPARARRRRDFFAMKRFVTGQASHTRELQQDALKDMAATAASVKLTTEPLRAPATAGFAAGAATIILDSAKYGAYLTRKAAAAHKTHLLDWTVAM